VVFPPVVHWVLEAGAFATGGLLYWRASNAASQPSDRWVRWGVLAGAALGAAIGSRALYALQYWTALAGQPLALWLGGKTLVGGLLGAVLGVELAKRALHWNLSTGDGFVLPLAIAIVIGRLGCQLSGVSDLTYGIVTTLPWGWNYGDGLVRHPTALYEIVGVIALAALLYQGGVMRRRGDQFRAFMVGYLVLRFALEFLKPPFGPAATGTLTPELWGPLAAIQWACVAGLAYYARDIYRWATQGQERG
jgi:phosphatidylglycerol---prolipoprotein diacylglyceryl transferase